MCVRPSARFPPPRLKGGRERGTNTLQSIFICVTGCVSLTTAGGGRQERGSLNLTCALLIMPVWCVSVRGGAERERERALLVRQSDVSARQRHARHFLHLYPLENAQSLRPSSTASSIRVRNRNVTSRLRNAGSAAAAAPLRWHSSTSGLERRRRRRRQSCICVLGVRPPAKSSPARLLLQPSSSVPDRRFLERCVRLLLVTHRNAITTSDVVTTFAPVDSHFVEKSAKF